MRARKEAHLVEVEREGGDGVRVVRDVEDQRRLARQHLEPPGQLDRREPGAHRLRAHRQALAQRLERRQRARGIEQLVGAAQRRIAEAAEAQRPGPAQLHCWRSPAWWKSTPARRRSAPMRAASSMTLRGGIGSLTMAGLPGRMMPAFSRPIDSRSVPRYSLWSMSMLVMTAQSPSKALTASRRPPSPTSRMTRSSGAAASRRAIASSVNSK